MSFCQVNDKQLSRKIPNFVHNTITRKKSDHRKALGPMRILQRLWTEAKKSLRINNITSKLNLRVVSSPKSLQIHCRHVLMISIVCRVTLTPQKVYTRTDRWFRVNRPSFLPSRPISHNATSSDNHLKSFTPELVQSFAARVISRR